MAYPQFTSFVPNCSLNRHLNKSSGGASNTHEYREYLQKNAIKLMAELRDCTGKNDCKICPVCNKALTYKPKGNIPSEIKPSKVTTNVNPYNQNYHM
jgi:hypothetical protein